MAKTPANLEELLHKMAADVGATEAAAFAVEPDFFDGQRRETLMHVRPDLSDDVIRAAAVAAFKDIVMPCLQQEKDGAIEIARSANETGTQFCLVTLARRAEKVVGVGTFIVRCRDRQ
jgi:hypothetical protein